MNLDWRVKALAQKLLWRLPGGVRVNTLLSHLTAGHDPRLELLQKHVPTFFRHWDVLRETGLMPGPPPAVLEIGTGWDLDVALLMSLHGVGITLTADVFRHVRFRQVRKNMCLFEGLNPQIAAHSHRDTAAVRADWEGMRDAPTLESLCERARIRYLAPVSFDYREIEDASVDVCYSTAVFEHIRPEEVRHILLTVRRKLRPGGLSSHIIDLKDHFAYFQRGLPYNSFLRYSAEAWEWWADNPMSYLNRMSAGDWRDMFRETGYEIVVFMPVEERVLPGIRLDLLHPEQRHRSPDDLRIGEIHVVARVG